MSPSAGTDPGEVGRAPTSRPDPLAAALSYAARGWPVFPVAGIVGGRCSCGRLECDHVGKHPLTRHGLHDATTDGVAIEGWWQRWPEANVGISTGPAQLVVIDVDPANGGWESLSRLYDAGYRWRCTWIVVSGGGGVHFYFGAGKSDPLRNTAGALPGVPFPLPGIDLRAAGGYVVAPPSAHGSGGRYRWLERPEDIAPAPGWLRPAPRVSRATAPPPTHVGDTPYGLAAVAGEVAHVRLAPVGSRNHELNRAAFALGQLVGAGHLTHDITSAALVDAAIAAGLPEREAQRTVDSGLAAGQARPRLTVESGRSVGDHR
jgi:hypothetical protein